MGHSLCKEYYEEQALRRKEYEVIPNTIPNLQMMGEREYERQQNQRLQSIPEESEKVFEY